MPAYFYVYIGRDSQENFEIGKSDGIWGWQAHVLSKSGKEDLRTNRQVAASMRPGDYLILGFSAPGGPRVKDPDFFLQDLHEVAITRVRRPLYISRTTVWPDEVYPERVDLHLLDVLTAVPGSRLGAAAMRALRRSGTKQGAPVPGVPVPASALLPDVEADNSDSLDIDGDLDIVVMAIRRKEQRRLRELKFRGRPTLTCDVCGRHLPARLLVAAHIKRRAESTNAERQNLHNVMAACLLGCDALFEYGHIYVDSAGLIRANAPASEPDLLATVNLLHGRRCTAYNPSSRLFFAAHAARSAQLLERSKRTDNVWPDAEWQILPEQGDRDLSQW